MKQGKNPTRQQKLAIQSVGLNVANWLVSKVDTRSNQLQLVHRSTGTVRVIPS